MPLSSNTQSESQDPVSVPFAASVAVPEETPAAPEAIPAETDETLQEQQAPDLSPLALIMSTVAPMRLLSPQQGEPKEIVSASAATSGFAASILAPAKPMPPNGIKEA